jgi:hypothetical protein
VAGNLEITMTTSSLSSSQTHDVDALQLIEWVWHDRWLVAAILVLAGLAGAAWHATTATLYQTTVSYGVNLVAPQWAELCSKAKPERCISAQAGNFLSTFIDQPHDVLTHRGQLKFKTRAPAVNTKVISELQAANRAATEALTSAARHDIDLVEKTLPNQLTSTEAAALRFFRAQDLLTQAQRDGKALLSFSKVQTRVASPHALVVLIVSLGIGLTLALVAVTIRTRLGDSTPVSRRPAPD